MNNYQFNLAWSNKDKEYMATCPEFPGLSAFGKTPEEALAEAKIALELFLETYEEDGIPLPEPQTVQEYSGQIRLRLPKSLHARAAKMSAEDGVSLNQFIALCVEARVSGRQVSERIIKEMRYELSVHNTTNVVLPIRRIRGTVRNESQAEFKISSATYGSTSEYNAH